MQTLADLQVRKLEHNLCPGALEKYGKVLSIYKQTPAQKRDCKDKIYSIHKSFTSCIAKGKSHRPYEFGNKIDLVTTAKSLVITGIIAI